MFQNVTNDMIQKLVRETSLCVVSLFSVSLSRSGHLIGERSNEH